MAFINVKLKIQEIKLMSNLNDLPAVSKRRITGQGMTEYIIVVALIAIACVAAVSYFGSTVQAQFVNMGSALTGTVGTEKGDAPATVAGAGLSDFGKDAK